MDGGLEGPSAAPKSRTKRKPSIRRELQEITPLFWTIMVPEVDVPRAGDDGAAAAENLRSLVVLADVFPCLREGAIAYVGRKLHPEDPQKGLDCALVFAAERGARCFAAAALRKQSVSLAARPHLARALRLAAKAEGQAGFLRWLNQSGAGGEEAIPDRVAFLFEACGQTGSAALRWLATLFPGKRPGRRSKRKALARLVDLSQRAAFSDFWAICEVFDLGSEANFRPTCARCFVEAVAHGNRQLAMDLDERWSFAVGEIALDNFKCFRLAATAGLLPDVEWLLGRFPLGEVPGFVDGAVRGALGAAVDAGEEGAAWYLAERFGVRAEVFAERLVAHVLIGGDVDRARLLIRELGVDAKRLAGQWGEAILRGSAERDSTALLDWLAANFDPPGPGPLFNEQARACAFLYALPDRIEMAQALARFCRISEEERRRLAARAVCEGRFHHRPARSPEAFDPVVDAFGVDKSDILRSPPFSALWPLSDANRRWFEWYIARFELRKNDFLELENRLFFRLFYSTNPGKALAWLFRRFALVPPEVEQLGHRLLRFWGGRLARRCPEAAAEYVADLLQRKYGHFGPSFGALPPSPGYVDEPRWLTQAPFYLFEPGRGPGDGSDDDSLLRQVAATSKIAAAWLLLIRPSWPTTEEVCAALEGIACAEEARRREGRAQGRPRSPERQWLGGNLSGE